MALSNGIASFQVGQGQSPSWLRAFNGYAVVSLAEDLPWQVRASPNNRNEFTLTYDGKDDMALTLGELLNNPDEITIIIKPLGDPPTRDQLWTLEEAIGPPVLPPMMIGRLQSCARPDLSASVGGQIPLPRIFLPVSAVPNGQARERPHAASWLVKYKEMH